MSTISLTDVIVNVATPTPDNPRQTTRILGPLSCTLTERRIGVIGANGSGKSTWARLMNGLVTPTAGTITIDGISVRTNPRAARSAVGFIFSDAENQIIMPSVREDIALSLRRFRLTPAERIAIIDALLHRFGLTDHADRSPHTLSGGQKQLLALAAVLATQPRTIVADEPTTLLDLRNRLRIAREFDRLEQQIIVVTHDLDFIRSYDRVLWIDKGKIRADGAPDVVIPSYIQSITSADKEL